MGRAVASPEVPRIAGRALGEDPSTPFPSIAQDTIPPAGRSEHEASEGSKERGGEEGHRPQELWGTTFPAPRTWDQGGSEKHPKLESNGPSPERAGPWLAMKAEGPGAQGWGHRRECS